jgi:ankyrin repeat protein
MTIRPVILILLIICLFPGNVISASKGVHKLIQYAYDNDIEHVIELVNNGAPVDTRDHYGKTTLMWAVVNENMKMTKFLISRGADLNARDVEGTTPLMWAVVTGNIKTIKLLIRRGADINIKDNYGKTALESSIKRNQKKIIKLLKMNGAKQ